MIIEDIYNIFQQIREIVTDSRNVTEGAIFLALKGGKFDGNKYAKKAIENGCSYAIIDNTDCKLNEKYILVDDVLKTLQLLANLHRRKLNMPIIGITGTNGKTTTKELIFSVLNQKYSVTSTKGNLNNHIGVPLTLLSMDEKTEIGVVEMGANHPGEIKQLCEIAQPDYGIITNIGKAHLEGFESFDNVIKAKKELYDYLNKTEGKVFYNSENAILKELVDNLEVEAISFGDQESIIKGEIMPSQQFLTADINIEDFNYKLKTKLVGGYNLENVLAAVLIGNYFKVERELIFSAIENYIPTNNRSQFFKTEKNSLFLDAYNANPTSVEASIRNFESLELPRKSVVLGDMLELGKDAVKEHENIIQLLNEIKFDEIILVGNIYSSIEVPPNMLQFKSVDDLKKWISKKNIKDSNILIKGSRGIQLEKIVELL